MSWEHALNAPKFPCSLALDAGRHARDDGFRSSQTPRVLLDAQQPSMVSHWSRRFLAHASQSISPVDQPFFAGTSTQPPPIWSTAGLRLDTGLTMSPSVAPTTLSLDSVTQPSPLTGLTTMSPGLSSTSKPPAQGIQSRPVLPARGPRTRDRHERKRSRLSVDVTTPLDSVDYWLDFDNDESLSSIPEVLEPQRPKVDRKGKAPMRR
jgi:hypothetical protein